MKKLLSSVLITALLLSMYPITASAADFSVNPFYAISSYSEYQNVKDTLKDKSIVYYGWSRIAKGANGEMVFTTDRNEISKFDTYSEYSVPESIDGKLTQEMRKEQYPGGKNLLMVFFSSDEYTDGSINTVDLLNMDSKSRDEKIITPMTSAVQKYGFDGIILDIEGIRDSYNSSRYDSSVSSNMKQKYNSFLGEIKSKLDGKMLSVCTNMPNYSGYDYSYIYNVADQIMLLDYTYDHYTSYEESDGVPELVGKIKNIDIPEAQPYDKVKSDVDKVMGIMKQSISNFNPKKLLLGVDLEINGWVKKELAYQSKAYEYYERVTSYGINKSFYISSLDEAQKINAPAEYIEKSPVYGYSSRTYRKVLASNTGSNIKSITYYYDTPGTMFEKYYSLVYDNNMSGIAVWRLGIGGTKTLSSMCSIFSDYGQGFDELPYKLNVPKDKTWSVKFNNPLDESSIVASKDSIGIVDTEGNLLNASISIDSSSNTVKVALPSSCKNGQIYYLVIGKSVKSKTGSPLSKPVVLKFKTAE